ncbi:MAG: hypothetical protein JXA83_13295 [Acidimicrobiales bacterium]|nr:hypothetical protein [Acidimicrobiales bacterium]
MTRRTLAALLVLLLAAGLTACGGDDADDEASDGTTTTEVAAPDEADGDEGADDTDDADPSDDGAGDDAGTRLDVDRTFTGEGSETFCADVAEAQAAASAPDAEVLSDAEFAAEMEAMDAPDEIAEEWAILFAVQKAAAEDPSGEVIASMSPDESDAWAIAGAIVARYLVEVCQLDE